MSIDAIEGSKNIENGHVRWLNSAYNILGQISRFSRWINTIGLCIFFIMMCLTFVDVVLRYLFSSPITGSKAYTEVLLVLLIAFTIAYTYDQKSHVGIEIITNRLMGKSKIILESITTLISVELFIVVVWRCIAQMIFFLQMGHMHGTAVQIPAAPFQGALALGSATLLLLLVRELLRNIIEGLKIHLEVYWWMFIFGISVLLLFLAILWMQPGLWSISMPLVGIIGVLCMLLFMFSGMPISFSLMLVGMVMIGHIRGTATAFNVLGNEIFSTSSNYLWSVAAFFILMGHFCLFARFGDDIYITFNRWFGHLRGGLAIATIIASTALAGIVGDALSVTTTMGTIAFPQMKKFKYGDQLSTGTIAAGATLGPLIPPSLGFIIYGVITGESIGKLFIAGIVPGILLAVFFILAILVKCRFDINAGPPGPKSAWGYRFSSLKYGGPIIALFLLVIGGIYAGVFTATEGGAIGCMGALVLGLLMRRIGRRSFIDSLVMTGRLAGMIFLIIIGAMIFSRFVAWCNLSGVLLNFLKGLSMNPKMIIMLMLLIFFILGFFIDIVPMLLIGSPICHPIAVALGADPIWFAVLYVLTVQIGVITPPFATILFALKGIVPDVPLSTIFTGVLPFVFATMITVIIMFLIPQVVTWLPDLLF